MVGSCLVRLLLLRGLIPKFWQRASGVLGAEAAMRGPRSVRISLSGGGRERRRRVNDPLCVCVCTRNPCAS